MIYRLSKGEETFIDICKAAFVFLFGCGLIFISPILMIAYAVGKASHGDLA